MRRFGRGLRLVRISLRVVIADPIILLVLGAGLMGTVALSVGGFVAVFHHLPTRRDLTFPRELVALPVLWFGTIVSSYCAVIVAVIADRRLRGQTPRVSEAIAVADARFGRILTWTLLSIAVGLVLQVIAERLKLGGWLASRLLGFAWGLATTFVVPVLALEDVGVRDSVRRSATIFRARWGESVVAEGTVGVVFLVALIPAAAATVAVATVSTAAAIVVGTVLIGTLMLLSSALDAVVDVALYRYAVYGTAIGGFTSADLDGAFRPKR